MTAMTRTPVTVAEMVNGDLVARSVWIDSEAESFVGISPSNPSEFVTLKNGRLAVRFDDVWQRLTKPATLCKCGEEIGRRDLDEFVSQWVHLDGNIRCAARLATPAEVTA